MQVRNAWNPLVMSNDHEFLNIIEGLSPNQIIAEYRLVFTRRVIVLVEYPGGGGYWSRKDWDCPVPVGASVRFVELPRGGGDSNPLLVIATIAIIAASIYAPYAFGVAGTLTGSLISAGVMIGGSLLLNMFFGNTLAGESSDVGTAKQIYSVNSGGNNLRIGQPFAECFGRFKRYPDLIQLSYTRIEDQEQYLYFYMIVGVGEYAIEGVFIDETPILEYEGAQYNVLPPGTTVMSDGRRQEAIPTIVPNIVWTSQEISGQELDTGWLTVVVSARGTSALHIEYDIQFPALVGYNDNGSAFSVSVQVVTEVRLVDDDGQPTSSGEWVSLHSRTYSAASKDSLRFSNKCPVPLGPGRYQFRARRTDESSEDSRISNKAVIIGLRAYGGLHPWYGNVTCIEGKVRASDKLSGDVINRINVEGIRKLQEVTNTGFGTSLQSTTSIVDAIAYMVTSTNGGRQDESFLKWDVLAAIKAQVDGSGHGFSWVFTSQASVMDAAKKAAQCSRMVPYMPGGQFCLVRDDYQELPSCTYTNEDYDEGSFKMTYSLASPDSPTCVRVNFLNSTTWSDDYVLYYDERGGEDIPYELTLEGCTSRQQAYEHAVYLYRDMINNSISVEFTTGLKGHIPALFRKICIDASHVDWGQSGKIVAVEPGYIWLSEPVDFKEEASGKMFINEPDGGTGGPYTVTPTENPYKVAGAIIDLKTLQDDDLQAASYLFGPASIDPLFIRLMGIQPQARNKIKLFGNIIDDSTYDLPGTAPDPPEVIPEVDPLVSVLLGAVGENTYRASWVGGASSFRVEIDLGSGYTITDDPLAGYSKSFSTESSSIAVRITPYYDNTLLSSQAMSASIAIAAAPAGLAVTADSESIDASWNAVTGATGYNVSIYIAGVSKVSAYAESTSFSAQVDSLAQIGGPWPDFDVRVSAMVGGVEGRYASYTVSVPALTAPAGLVLQSVLSNGVMLSWGSVTGATGYKIYVGNSSDFDPETEGSLVYSGSETSCLAAVDVTSPYTYHFKVAATNAYYHDVADLIFSGSLEVSS